MWIWPRTGEQMWVYQWSAELWDAHILPWLTGVGALQTWLTLVNIGIKCNRTFVIITIISCVGVHVCVILCVFVPLVFFLPTGWCDCELTRVEVIILNDMFSDRSDIGASWHRVIPVVHSGYTYLSLRKCLREMNDNQCSGSPMAHSMHWRVDATTGGIVLQKIWSSYTEDKTQLALNSGLIWFISCIISCHSHVTRRKCFVSAVTPLLG